MKALSLALGDVREAAGTIKSNAENTTGSANAVSDATQHASTNVDTVPIGGTIEEMASSTGAITDAVERQKQATGEIASSASDAAHRTRQVSENISTVNTAAQDTDGAADALHLSAENLARQKDQLGALLDRFMNEVKSFEKLVGGAAAGETAVARAA